MIRAMGVDDIPRRRANRLRTLTSEIQWMITGRSVTGLGVR
jgi:hypothetical protein